MLNRVTVSIACRYVKEVHLTSMESVSFPVPLHLFSPSFTSLFREEEEKRRREKKGRKREMEKERKQERKKEKKKREMAWRRIRRED